MKRIYISGKISGLDMETEVIPKFQRAEGNLLERGYEPVNPLKLKPSCENPEWADHMKVDLIEMLKCDAIYALPDWASSRGATIEVLLALELGMLVEFAEV